MAYLCVRYNVNSGTISTGTGTTRYRVSSSLVQRSTDSGSTWATYYTNFSATATTNYVNLVDVATFGITRTGYRIASDATAYRAKSTTGNVINQATTSSSSANAATVARLNGSVPSSNTTINVYVNWVANTYTVTLNRNGGPANGTASVTATYASAMPSATMPTRAGYTFNGYYDATSGGTQYYYANGVSARTWNKTAATTLYARWTKNNYNLTLALGQYGQYQVLPYDGKIEHWDDSIVNNIAKLAQHGDGKFASGVNDVTAYQFNKGSTDAAGTSTVTRISKKSDNPLTGSSYELQIDSYINTDSVTDTSYNCRMGWVQTTTSAASQVFVHLFVAKIPRGVLIQWAANATGDGNIVKWLTPRVGTGKYEIYAYEHTCGSTGTFSTFGHIYIIPSSITIPSTITWYLAYSEIFKTTRSQVFSTAYNTNLTNLPIPVGAGRMFRGWCTAPNGTSNFTLYGRDMFYTNNLCAHIIGYMSNWAEYVTGDATTGAYQMRLFSCTESGGWNIESTDGVNVCAAGYDSGVGYKNALSSVPWSSLSSGWHTFDVIFDGSNLKLYLDRILIATSDTYTSGKIGYHSANGLFGGAEAAGTETTPGGNYFHGYMGDAYIANNTTLLTSDKHYITMPAANVTRTAYWGGTAPTKLPDSTYTTLHFDANGGICQSTLTDKYSAIVTLPKPIRPGYKFKGWSYNFDGYNYLCMGKLMNYTDKFSVHFEAYKEDWSTYYTNTEQMISCTQGGGWGMFFNEYVYVEAYDSGASAYKSITSDVTYASLESGWHSFDIVFDGTYLMLYLDDVLLGTSEAFSGPISYATYTPLLLGAEPGTSNDRYGASPTAFTGNPFIGKIKNFMIDYVDTKLEVNPLVTVMPAQDANMYAEWEKIYPKFYTSVGWKDGDMKYYYDLSDLSNTTWVFNDTLELPDTSIEYNINFHSSLGDCTKLSLSNSTVAYKKGINLIQVYNTAQTTPWSNANYKTITIYDGDDIDNLELMEWLKSNATLTSTPTIGFNKGAVKVYTENGWEIYYT